MSEIEEQFFEVFGIPPLCCKKYLTNCMRYNCESCENFDNTFSTYPQITDRILLMLICTLNKSRLVSAVNLSDVNYEDLKNTILKKNITILKNDFLNHEIRNEFKHQVQALFKEDS